MEWFHILDEGAQSVFKCSIFDFLSKILSILPCRLHYCSYVNFYAPATLNPLELVKIHS